MEGLSDKSFTDQVDYYNLVCLLCSDQFDRVLAAANATLERKPRHSYRDRITELIDDLESR